MKLTKKPLVVFGNLPEYVWWEDIPYVNFHSSGILFSNDVGGCNAHWYDLRHPWERYSRGDYRWVFFFKQIWRGLHLCFTNRMAWE